MDNLGKKLRLSGEKSFLYDVIIMEKICLKDLFYIFSKRPLRPQLPRTI